MMRDRTYRAVLAVLAFVVVAEAIFVLGAFAWEWLR